MKLAELTPSEIAFLTATPDKPGDLPVRLTQRLGLILSARLRLPVTAQAREIPMLTEALIAPVWQIDASLATLWLTRRLGGQQVVGGRTSFIPPTLIHALDTALAECWLDEPGASGMPASLAWQLITNNLQASLAVQLPLLTTDMTRWARGVIRHG